MPGERVIYLRRDADRSERRARPKNGQERVIVRRVCVVARRAVTAAVVLKSCREIPRQQPPDFTVRTRAPALRADGADTRFDACRTGAIRPRGASRWPARGRTAFRDSSQSSHRLRCCAAERTLGSSGWKDQTLVTVAESLREVRPGSPRRRNPDGCPVGCTKAGSRSASWSGGYGTVRQREPAPTTHLRAPALFASIRSKVADRLEPAHHRLEPGKQ